MWTQVVSDVTGQEQELRTHSFGASYGSAYLAAAVVEAPSLDEWNPIAGTVRPRAHLHDTYDELYHLYRALYIRSADVVHALAERQVRTCTAPQAHTTQKEP